MYRMRTAAVIAAVFLFSVPVSAAAQSITCPTGQRLSTADDVRLGLPANTCIDAAIVDRLKGGCDYNPYDMLESQYRGNPNAQIRPVAAGGATAELRQGIDPALACRLTKLFEAAKQRGCQIKISSAYRSAQQQAGMCGAGRSGCAPAGRSCHQYGLAVDVTGGCLGWLRMVAPQFQLVFPYYGEHIQCAEHPRAACSPQTQACNGGVRINPDLSTMPSPSQVPNTYFQPPPATAGSNPFANPYSPLTQQPLQQTPAQTQTQTGTTPTTNGQTYPLYPTDTTNPIPNTTGSTTTYSQYTMPTTTYNPVIASTTSFFDSLLNNFTDRTTTNSSTGVSSPTQSAGPAALNEDLNDRATSTGESGNISPSYDNSTVTGTIAKNSVDVDPILVTETFTGTGNRPAPVATSGAPAAKDSVIRAMLLVLRDFLISLLNALKARQTGDFTAPWQIPSAIRGVDHEHIE